MRIYTVNEASKLLKIKPSTVYQYIRMGYIKAKKIGYQWHISQREINKRLNRFEVWDLNDSNCPYPF